MFEAPAHFHKYKSPNLCNIWKLGKKKNEIWWILLSFNLLMDQSYTTQFTQQLWEHLFVLMSKEYLETHWNEL